MLWDPIRYAETCPSSDGACAMVLASEAVADRAEKPPAWARGTAMRSEPTMSADRDTVLPRGGSDCAADVFAQAGTSDPRRQVDCVAMYVPFSWVEPSWLEQLGLAGRGAGGQVVGEM